MANRIELNKLTNANIYCNGASLLGRAEEIKLPTVTSKKVDHKALGMVANIKLPGGGIDTLEGEIKWNSFYQDVWRQLLNPYQSLELQVRGSLDTYSNGGRIAQVPYIVFMTLSFDSVPLGDLKQNDNAEFQSKYTATYVKQQVNGQDVLEIDVLANIHKVAGEDMLATYRQNIGG
jgi:P2 family phage contractile tail tube protein